MLCFKIKPTLTVEQLPCGFLAADTREQQNSTAALCSHQPADAEVNGSTSPFINTVCDCVKKQDTVTTTFDKWNQNTKYEMIKTNTHEKKSQEMQQQRNCIQVFHIKTTE